MYTLYSLILSTNTVNVVLFFLAYVGGGFPVIMFSDICDNYIENFPFCDPFGNNIFGLFWTQVYAKASYVITPVCLSLVC